MSTEYRKHRNFLYKGTPGYVTSRSNSDGTLFASHGPREMYASGDQTTMSHETRFPTAQRLRRRAEARGRKSAFHRNRWDLGAPFTTYTHEYSDHGAINRVVNIPNYTYLGTTHGYQGPILGTDPRGIGSNFPVINLDDLWQEMRQWGSTAIANTIPTNPSVDVGNLIGESMQRLPSLPGAAILGRPGNVSKKFADEYLNVEFGLRPLLSDIDGIASTVKNTNRILEQLERDSGRLIRRRYGPVSEHSFVHVVDDVGKFSYPSLHTTMYEGNGTRSVYRQVEKRMWFSGAYTYYYAQGSDLWSRLRRAEQAANRLGGLRLSPSLAWELAPWSWAADWVTNAGDVIRNISAFSRDGLVLRWGYVMCEYIITDIHRYGMTFRSAGVHRTEQRFKTHVKTRVRATPYGFGLDPDWKDFSSRQLAILGALGISRGR